MKQETKQAIFLILMTIFIILLIFVIVFLVKNKDLIKSNPIDYGVKLYNFSYCNCFKDNQFVKFPDKLETTNLTWDKKT